MLSKKFKIKFVEYSLREMCYSVKRYVKKTGCNASVF